MVWVLVDVAVVVVSLVVLALAALGLWRRVKALGRAVAVASTQVAGLTDALDSVSAPREPATAVTTFTPSTPRRHVSPTPASAPGVRSTRSS